MKAKLFKLCVLVLWLLALVPIPAARATGPAGPALQSAPRVAYVYNTDTASRDSFNTLLTGRGIVVDLVALSSAAAFNYAPDQAIIIGDDTGSLGTWGDAATVKAIGGSGRPIVGVGEGGYAFFGTAGLGLDIGYALGAHGSLSGDYIVYPTQSIFTTPNVISIPSGNVLALYSSNVNTVEIYGPGAPGAVPVGRDPGNANYFPLTTQQQSGLCRTLWGHSGSPALMTAAGQNLFVNIVRGQPCAAPRLNSTYVSAPPRLDGSIDFGEWPAGNPFDFSHGVMYAANDGLRLYLLVDVLGDTVNDPPSVQAPDYFWLTFDANRDGNITPNVDLNYTFAPNVSNAYNMRYQYYTGSNTWTSLQSTTRSALGPGFGCFFADGTLTISGLFPPRFNCANHRVWEFGIDLREIGAAPGQTARMGLRVASGTPNFSEDIPANFTADFSNLIQVSLAPLPSALPPSNANATLGFQAKPLEVTQAIQNLDNTLPLVADKDTVARVYVQAGNTGTTEPAIVYLYGTRGGNDLPGSPLVTLINASTAPQRTNFNQSANFLLPAAWIASGADVFQAGVAKLSGPVGSSSTIPLSFNRRRTPLIWVVPLNTGTAASPNTVSNATIQQQQSYLRAIYPVPGVRWVQKPWQDIGAIGNASLDTAKQDLNNYYNSAVLAWVLSVIFTGKAPYDLPDLVYGFMTSGGGSSDPTWYNSGGGHVAAGFLGSSLEGTMAHELNHDLDRSTTGTWGRHVGNPDSRYWFPSGQFYPPGDTAWGCGASGPDGSWPTPPNNDNLREIGFDTRRPWSDGSGGQDTVIPSTRPDIMSYCQSGRLPTKWISPYRWQHLYNDSIFASVPALNAIEATQAITDVYYISGRVNADNTGSLNPVLAQPGLVVTSAVSGGYSLELQNSSGTPLQTMPFAASFSDPEGEPLTSVFFNFALPRQPGVTRIVLKQGTQVLAVRSASQHAPVVALTFPAGGEVLSGTQVIRWSASDADGDPLAFTVLFSPDGGNAWMPLGSGLTASELSVNMSLLPATTLARVRVVATDGFNTTVADSNIFQVQGGLPSALISTPQDRSRFEAGALIHFTGDGSSALGTPLPDNQLLWSYVRTGGVGNAPSSGPTTFGAGRAVDLALPEGVYDIVLTAVDGSGSSQSTLTILVGVNQVYLPLLSR